MKTGSLIILLLVFGILLFPRAAHAYLDPGTGSLIFQMIVAAGVGALFFLRVFWRRLKGIFGGQKESEEQK